MSTLLAATLIASGLATSYSDGVMAEVVANRIAWNQLPPDTDAAQGVALLTCDRLGERVWITTPTRILPAVVTDCAQAGHRAELVERGWAVDLSAELAAELGAVLAPLAGVQVWDGFPMRMVWR